MSQSAAPTVKQPALTEAADVLAVDIGGTKIAASLVGPAGQVRERRTVPTPAAAGGAAVLAAAIELGRHAAGRARPAAVGIGSAGVIDPRRGVVIHATDALRGWVGVDLAAGFATAFDVPAFALNDVHAHGLGEARHGAGRGSSSLLLVAVGTGIGGAHVIGDHLDAGAHFVGGHVGHVPVPEAAGVACSCGREGHVEGLASGPGMLAAFRRAGGLAESAQDVVRLAESGVAGAEADLARLVVATCGTAVGRAIGGLLNVLDPAVVAVGGGVAQAGPRWWKALRAGVLRDAMDAVADTPVVPAAAGQNAALLGAAAWARRHLQA